MRVVKFNPKRHKKTPCITDDIIKSINVRNKLYKKLKQCRSNAFNYRTISEIVFILSIATNRADPVCVTVIIKHNYKLMCNHKIVINIMLCLLNSTGHI